MNDKIIHPFRHSSCMIKNRSGIVLEAAAALDQRGYPNKELINENISESFQDEVEIRLSPMKPLVSCILPTANRYKYIPLAIDYFLQQDYSNKELIIIDDGKESIGSIVPDDAQIKYYYTEPLGTVGVKRNYACDKANGEIIMHWDDDDWHASDWISKQVEFLLLSEADICGIEHVHFFSPITDTFWAGTAMNRNHPSNAHPWLNGATLAYWKSFWKKHPFLDKQKGEDDEFVMRSGAKIFAHDYIDGFVALLHPNNTTVKYFEDIRHKMKPGNV